MEVTSFPMLLVEDEPDDIGRVQKALAQANLVNPLRTVNDGRGAIAYLSGEEKYADRESHPFPSLLLLDMTLPNSSALGLLAWIRSQQNLKTLPVILLTPATADPREFAPYAAQGVTVHLVKPVDGERLLEAMKSIGMYWVILDRTRPVAGPPRVSLQGRHVLVVDRDAEFLRSLGEALLRRVPPMVVDPATTPAEALGRLARNSRDVLVYERGVEEGDEFGFLSRIRALKPDLPVIVLCAERDEAYEIRAIRKGVAGVLLKQARKEEFLDQLHGLLGSAKPPVIAEAPHPAESKPPADSSEAISNRGPRQASRSGRRQDTDILGNQINFALTSWELVRSAPKKEALDSLIRIYWKPLYFFVRQRGFDNEEAKDIVQEFLARALESRIIRRADPLRGRFRTFLLASLSNFLKDRRRSRGRLKRGGGHAPLSLAQFEVEPRYARPVHAGEPPEIILDRAWAKELLDQCLLELEGLPSHLRAFELKMQGADYERIAKETGLSQTAAKTAIHRLRLRLRKILRTHLSGENATEEEVGLKVAEFASLLA